MPIDVETARALTPACARLAHFNNAGASLSPEPVLDTVIRYLRREAEIGGYEAADEAALAMDATYASVATLLGCRSDEVALVESSTVAWLAAFCSIPFQRGDRILTGRAEYISNAVAMLQVQERDGVVVEVVEDDEHGQISVDALRSRLDDDVKLIALTHVPTNGGLVNPAAEVGKVAREAGVLYLLDACQSVGQMPIDVEAIGCDMLAATGRKFLHAPRGTGFLYVRRDVADRLVPYVLDYRSALWTSPDEYEIASGAQRFEVFEHSHATLLGLGTAIDYALGLGVDAIAQRNRELAGRLRSGLTSISGVTVRDKGIEQSAIVTFTVDGHPSAEVSTTLRAARINTSVTIVPNAQFDMPLRGLTDMVRASAHYYNTEAEVDRLLGEVAAIASA